MKVSGERYFPRVGSKATSNGVRRDEATFQFETVDRLISLPISGSVVSLTIEGECTAAEIPTTLAGLEHVIHVRTQEILGQDRALQSLQHQLGWHEQTLATYRSQLARQDDDLEALRHHIESYGRTNSALTQRLEGRERHCARLEQRIADLEQVRAELEGELKEIVSCRRWIVINHARSVLYYLPQRLRALRARLQRGLSFVATTQAPR